MRKFSKFLKNYLVTRILTNQKPNCHEFIRVHSIKIRVYSCKKDFFLILFELLIISLISIFLSINLGFCAENPKAKKLYWFIPDGMRAEPDLFNIFQWAEEGKLPNIKKMMDNGAYGYSIPVFPSHTPANFATLLTGSYPKTHGVADGPMHIEGYPLDKPSLGGFSSVAKKVDPIWVTLEKAGKKVLLLSVPGSTPPELDSGITIRGRWGGWGADFPAINFEPKNKKTRLGRERRLFFFGPELTQYVDADNTGGAWCAKLNAFGENIRARIYDERVAFSAGENKSIASLKQGEWSRWIPLKLNWQGNSVDSHLKINLIKQDNEGFFRIRFLYDNLNDLIVKPSFVAQELVKGIGPMVDTVDNFPPQLVYYPEDKKTFLDEAGMSLDWHRKAVGFIFDRYHPDIFIHDIYTPNQMLTSRWWMGYFDSKSSRYEKNSFLEKEAQSDILWLYKKLDAILGEALKKADMDTLIVLSSDHGAIPLNKYVRINNLLAKEGLLKFRVNLQTNEPVIDWKNSKAIYLKMDNIYINPEGLEGNYHRAKGKDYEELREKVTALLYNLADKDGKKPIAKVVKWEDAGDFLELPADRVGDLVIANNSGYGFYEEMTEDLEIFTEPLESGYKQAVLPEEERGMWTPFVIMGPGIKKGYRIEKPIRHIDQYPTIMRLLGVKMPDFVEGKAFTQIYSVETKENKSAFSQAVKREGISINGLTGFWLEKKDIFGEGRKQRKLFIGKNDEDKIIRVEIMGVIEPQPAQKYIRDRSNVLESLFKTIPAPYPGEVAHSIEVPVGFRPESFDLKINGRACPVYILYSTSRLTYGIGAEDLITYRAALAFIYNKQKKRLSVLEFFVPKDKFVKEEALEVIQSFSEN